MNKNIYFVVSLLLSSSAILAVNNPRYYLDRMSDSGYNFNNISYTVEYNDLFSEEYMDNVIEYTKNSNQTDKNPTSKTSIHQQQIQRWIHDNEGRTQITMETAEKLNASGQLIFQQTKIPTTSWDGEREFTYLDFSEKQDYGSIKNEPSAFVTRQRQPLNLFTGGFAKKLKKALKEEREVSVSQEQDFVRIEIVDSNRKYVSLVDPKSGYSCVSEQKYKDGKILYERLAEYTNIESTIWFPTHGEITVFSPNGSESYRTSVDVKDVKINSKEIDKSSFQLKFPDGTFVEDYVLSIGYIAGQPNSKRLLDIGSVSADIIATEEIKYLPGHKTTTLPTVFLPDLNIAISKKLPFLYNLQERKFSAFGKGLTNLDNEAFIKSIKPGDIAWNGNLLLFDNTKIEPPLPKNIRVQEHTHYRELEVSGKTPLPASFTIKVDKETGYHLTLREIRDNGILISWKKLSR